MKWFMRILGIVGIVLCLCGFAMAGIGYAFGGMDYIRANNLADIKNVFFRSIKTASDYDGIEVDVGNIKVGDMPEGSDNKVREEKRGTVGTDSNDVSVWELDNFKLQSVSSIEANLDYIDLKIEVSEDKDFHMSYELHCMNRKNPLSYSLENGILKLTETDFKAPSWKGWLWNTESITDKYDSCITLYVPLDTVLKSCVLNVTDSDLMIKELHCNTLEIEAADGDMDIAGGSCDKVVLKAADGDIAFFDTSVSGDLLFDTADGDVSVSDIDVKGAMQLDTADGDVSFSGIKVLKGMKINAADGDISVSNLTVFGAVEMLLCDGDLAISDFTESDGVYIQTECGDISASALDITGELQINTAEGDVLLSNLGVSGKAEIESRYGDISVQLKKSSLSDLKITMDTEDGELSAAHSLGGKKSGGHYEKSGSDRAYLTGYTEEGDISIQ
ncbi:MAG TPA: hypothetical protein DDY31_15670 [Lachnospiraceae bacterium]|nr:hypothetical protein [Lachnospiraceae bacterium]